MGYNKIPLALKFNDTTGNAEGLQEFTLNLSDTGDVCSATPSNNQALVWSGGADGYWCPSTLPTGGGGGTPTLPAGSTGDILINDGGTTYIASAASDAGFVTVDHVQPFMVFSEEGEMIKYNGTELEAAFPDSVFIKVKADGETINQGDAVYVTTTEHTDDRLRVAKADASDSTKMPAVGIIHTQGPINSGSNALIVSFGKAVINTTGMTSPTPGQVLYVGTTAGQITNEKPTGENDLIQNIGILSVTGSAGKIKVTGVGRSNDIPVNVDVVGSATIGTNEFTQTSAKLANVGADHILISTATSATSSIASATLFDQGITDQGIVTDDRVNVDNNDLLFKTGGSITGRTLDELDISTKTLLSTTSGNLLETPTGGANGNILFQSTGNATTSETVSNFISTNSIATTPIADGDLASTFIKTDASTVNPPNLSGTVTNGQLIKRSSDTQFAGVDITTLAENFLNTNTNITHLNDVVVTSPAQGEVLIYQSGNRFENKLLSVNFAGVSNNPDPEGAINVNNVFTSPPGTTGDSDLNSGFVYVSGVDASATELVTGKRISDEGIPFTFHSDYGDPVVSSNATALTQVTSVTVPANILPNGHGIEFCIEGRIFASGQNLRIAVDMGGTTILNSQIGLATETNDTRYTLRVTINNTSTETDPAEQIVIAKFEQGAGFAAGAGFGNWSSMSREGIMHNSATIDNSGTFAFALKIQHSNNSNGEYFSIDNIRGSILPAAG